jgi:hypothetical protein
MSLEYIPKFKNTYGSRMVVVGSYRVGEMRRWLKGRKVLAMSKCWGI